jgi:fructokinase
MTGRLLVGIETGGTKIHCASATVEDPKRILTRISIPTRGPDETLAAVARFVEGIGDDVAAIGVASFGPLDLDEESPSFGRLTSTPKRGWDGVDVLACIRVAAPAGTPIQITTDVAGAAFAEAALGEGRASDRLAYVTVGTGVGAGIDLGGEVLVGTGWPEIGHLPVARHPQDTSPGTCRFHGDCLEGLASGPAISARSTSSGGAPSTQATDLSTDITAFYLAQLVAVLYFTLGIETVVLSGGVLKTPGLLHKVRETAAHRVGAAGSRGSSRPLTVTSSAFEGDAGLYGALLLANRAARNDESRSLPHL